MNEFSIMKTSDQSKKTWWFWQQRGRIKRVENSSNRVSKKYFFHLLLSIFQQTWGPKMSNNKSHDKWEKEWLSFGFGGVSVAGVFGCGWWLERIWLTVVRVLRGCVDRLKEGENRGLWLYCHRWSDEWKEALTTVVIVKIVVGGSRVGMVDSEMGEAWRWWVWLLRKWRLGFCKKGCKFEKKRVGWRFLGSVFSYSVGEIVSLFLWLPPQVNLFFLINASLLLS